MRLLKTKSYELLEAHDLPVPFPHYAILSHTWISPKDEITYQDIKSRKGDIESGIFKQKGWSKLKRYCDRTAKDGWDWAWMDTCCIDKTNPADTQEAINAMFRWYQNAGVCYAYLEDLDILKVAKDADLPEDKDLDVIIGSKNFASSESFLRTALNPLFIGSNWFTRGWTLQELLAPHYLVFVDSAWRRIGTRESWAEEIEKASKIEPRHLTAFTPTDFKSCSIAMRLSWASRRETTLEEDETYSLLGLFGISMPLIYGEGKWRAFNRLQRELIMAYKDDSIFAWKAEKLSAEHVLHRKLEGDDSGWGILARSVKQFWDASQINTFGHYGSSFCMTNRGLETNATHWRNRDDPTLCLLRLDCGVSHGRHTGIYLRLVDDSYDRIRIKELCNMDGTTYSDDWKEFKNAPILIRAQNYSNMFTYPSIFSLEYSDQIHIGAKYFVDFSTSFANSKIQPLDESSHSDLVQGLGEHELIMDPNRIVFINIELQAKRFKSEHDVIINLTENSFPSVGILARGREKWKRLGDPLEQAAEIYGGLANYLHTKVPLEPTYPMMVKDETRNYSVGIHLFPRPPRARSLKLPPEHANSVTLREYVLKIMVEQEDYDDEDVSNQPAKRIRIS